MSSIYTENKWDSKKRPRIERRTLLPLLLFILIISMFMFGITDTQRKSKEQQRDVLQQSLQRAVMHYYATEGIYPQSISEIQRHYGIVIDDKRYIVHYESFSTNVIPEITVYER